MSLTDIAFTGGITCTTAGMLVLALGLISRKPRPAPKPRQPDEDFWPEYQAKERKTNQ